MNNRKSFYRWAPLALVLIGFALMALWAVPIGSIFEIDSDEGINLAKASLLNRGFPLYHAIWSDQPPLTSWIWAFVLRLFGNSVVAARLVCLLFSLLLIASFFELIRCNHGSLPAFIGVVFLTLSYGYIRLSVSIMIGLISLSFILMGLLAMAFSETNSTFFAPLSGFLCGCAVLCKLWTIPLAFLPILMVRFDKQRLRGWFVGFATALLPAFLIIGPKAMAMLVAPHISAFLKTEPALFLQGFAADWILIATCAAGLILSIREKNTPVVPAVWLVYGLLFVLFHRPVRYHHFVLLAIPMSWWTAIAVSKLKGKMAPRIGITAVVLLFVAIKVNSIELERFGFIEYDKKVAADRWFFLKNLSQRGQSNPWVFTDRPMYAFRAGLLVPPEIAVFSVKRFQLLEVDKTFLEEIFNRYKIKQVLWARYDVMPASLHSILKNDFNQMKQNTYLAPYYVRKQNFKDTE